VKEVYRLLQEMIKHRHILLI